LAYTISNYCGDRKGEILVIFCKNITFSNKKIFGQKIMVLAHGEGSDVAETFLCSIFKHLETYYIASNNFS
jgi:hypothetical protein